MNISLVKAELQQAAVSESCHVLLGVGIAVGAYQKQPLSHFEVAIEAKICILVSALPVILGSAAQAALLPSLAPIVGGRSAYNKDSKPEKKCWAIFFAFGCRMAREMKEETARIRGLRDEALESDLLRARPRAHSSIGRTGASDIASTRPRRPRPPAPKASSDAPATCSP